VTDRIFPNTRDKTTCQSSKDRVGLEDFKQQRYETANTGTEKEGKIQSGQSSNFIYLVKGEDHNL
jgi:hypothetical protein